MLSFPHSLARNNLVDEWSVNKSEVQGSSFEVGAKVTYEGREMTVSQAPDSHGHMTMMDLSGVMALTASLPECGLTSLECAAPKCLPLCQRPLTLTACLSPWQCGRPPASDRRAQGHKADREDRPLVPGAGRCLHHHHRELHQGERRAQNAEVRRRPIECSLLCPVPIDTPLLHLAA